MELSMEQSQNMEAFWINKMIQAAVEPDEMLISLDDEFTLSKGSCHVKLRNNYFSYETAHKTTPEKISIKDLFSCIVTKQATKCQQKFSIHLKLITYPLVDEKIQRKSFLFHVNKANTWEENLSTAEKWKDLIFEAMYNIPGGLKSTANYENIRTTRPLFGSQDASKRFVIYVNPKSGTGISAKIYKNNVEPMLAEAGIPHDVIMTNKRLVAHKSVQSLDLSLYTGIVVVSGDGLLYEIYNGLLCREDWYDAISFPVSIIPGGSGNGLATSLGYILSEPYNKNPVLVSALNILNPTVTPMDLVIVNTHNKQRLLSFLSISIGLLADIDIESECIRSIGYLRFTIWSIRRLLSLRTYRCRLSYKIARKMRCQRKANCPLKHRATSDVPEPSNGVDNGITLRRVHDKYTQRDEISMPNEIPNGNLNQEEDDDDEFYPDYAKILVDKSFTDPDFDVLGQPVPKNWHVVEDDFVLIISVLKPFIGTDGFISPLSSLSDGIMYLWVIKKDAPRKVILNFLLSISHGPEPNEFVQRIPVTAFRIEPLSEGGNLVIDGEVIEYGPIQAAVLPGKGSLMTRPL